MLFGGGWLLRGLPLQCLGAIPSSRKYLTHPGSMHGKHALVMVFVCLKLLLTVLQVTVMNKNSIEKINKTKKIVLVMYVRKGLHKHKKMWRFFPEANSPCMVSRNSLCIEAYSVSNMWRSPSSFFNLFSKFQSHSPERETS